MIFSFFLFFFSIVLAEPPVYCIAQEIQTTNHDLDTFTITYRITRSLAPLGADHLYQLVKSGFYNQSAIFRVVPNFVFQFGIAGDPSVNAQHTNEIKDDPVLRQNKAGTIVYATSGPDTRTTQLFVNLVDNVFLDQQGFAPLGVAIDGWALSAQKINNPTSGNTDGISQSRLSRKGISWALENFPNVSIIKGMAIIPSC